MDGLLAETCAILPGACAPGGTASDLVARLAGTLAMLGICWRLSAIDLREGILPNEWVAALAATGALTAALSPVSTDWRGAAVGAAVAFSFAYAMRWATSRAFGYETAGFGDVKFAAAAGVWLGVGALNAMALIVAATGLLQVCLDRASGVDREVRLGPHLCFALAFVHSMALFGVEVGPGWPFS